MVKTLKYLAALVFILCSCTVHSSSQQVLSSAHSTTTQPNQAAGPDIDDANSYLAGPGGI